MATRPPVRSPRTSKSAARKPRSGSTTEPLHTSTHADNSGALPGATCNDQLGASEAEVTSTSLERRDLPSFSLSREARIAESAYWRAERRGFQSGHELDDWLDAEREIDRALAGERQDARQPGG